MMAEKDADLHFLSLPPPAAAALRSLNASPRLLGHHLIVHHVAATILVAMAGVWPDVSIDREAVLVGAATHDLGKTLHPEELTGPGRKHENDGPALLEQLGITPEHARFARTHGQWAHEPNPPLEDLLVTLANTIWQGTRNQRLEDAITQRVAGVQGREVWQVFMELDDIIVAITEDAEIRIAWLDRQDA
ncbi:MAG TPA: HD domain-containing protein [Chloroflexota bacterium]|nr:HD domain-containing protein [Chloroflexota bacterium]